MSNIITVSHKKTSPTGQIRINNLQNTEKDKIIETNTFFNLNLINNKQLNDLNNDDNVFMAEQKHLRALDCIKDGSVDPKIIGVNDVVYNNFNDFDSLASLVSICDFVITSSNVTAHLSGALNKKTYLLLPHSHGKIWYWGTSGNSSLWYPSIHIFRSKTPDNWHGVIKELWSALK